MSDPHFDLQTLEQQLLQYSHWTAALGITPENARRTTAERSALFHQIYPKVYHLCQDVLQIQLDVAMLLWNLWLPLGLWLMQRRQHQSGVWVQGILGGQGTGKTTLAAVLTLILQHLGQSCLSLSLDDLYKTYADRLTLQAQDPRLIWRGPPGTHDIDLGLSIIQQLRQATPETTIAIPRFDKSLQGGQGDRTAPELIHPVDIVLFEGWFVGIKPIPAQKLQNPPAPIHASTDQIFARDMNDRLQAYQPLWDQLDSLIVLHPIDYRLSKQWRQQAEQQRIDQGKSGMNEAQIHQFVEYFWKALHPELFLPPVLQSKQTDLVIQINADHSFGRIYCPALM